MKKLLYISIISLFFSCSNKPQKIDAFVESQHYVEYLLNKPLNASFSYNKAVEQVDYHTFEVDANVSFIENGSSVHENYSCTVVYNDNFTMRTITNFKFY